MKKYIMAVLLVMGLTVFTNSVINAEGEIHKEVVNVKLKRLGNQTNISLGVSGKYIIDSDQRTLTGTNFSIKAEDGVLKLYSGSTLLKSYGTTLSMHPETYGTSHSITINGVKHIGVFTFTVESGKYVRPTNTLLMEDYLKGVTPNEMYGTWNVNTLKAGTLAARTFALNHAGRTMEDTEYFQVYGGYTWYNNSNQAADETKGEVIKYNNRLIEALYYSSNGGMVLSNTNTYGSPLYPYFTKKEDPYDLQSGKYTNWSYRIKKEQIDLTGKDLTKPELWWGQAAEADSSFIKNLKDKIIGIQIEKNSDIRITNVTALHFKTAFTANEVLTGYIDIEYFRKNMDTNEFVKDSTGKLYKHTLRYENKSNAIRGLVGTKVMLSPYVKSVKNDTEVFTVNGAGFGHGVGMSQWGANVMGIQGKSYQEILSYYYPNTTIVKEAYHYPAINVDAFSSDLTSPQAVNKAIKLTATATGGYDKVYRFWIQEGTEWKMIQDYSTKNTYTWVPKVGGDYNFLVHVKDKYSSIDFDGLMTLDYRILSDIKVNGITADKPSPQTTGTLVNITADAQGGNERLYKFNLLKDGVWEVVQDYSPNSTFSWMPTLAGDYKFSVHVKDSNSSKSYDAYGVISYEVKEKLDPVVMESVTTDKPSPQLANTAVNITANASGGSTKLYKFNIHDGKTWVVTQNYSTKNTHQWLPSKPGDYKVSVHVKDQNSTKSYDSYKAITYKVTAPSSPVSIQSIITDKSSPQPAKSTIKITANASGGTTRLYKFWLSKDGGSFVKIQDYSTNSIYNWTPSLPGNYKINVHVKDNSSSKSYDAYKVISYTIK